MGRTVPMFTEDAQLLGRSLVAYKATASNPTATPDRVAFANLRIRSIMDELHTDAINTRWSAVNATRNASTIYRELCR